MTYEANYATAVTYLEAGFFDRGLELMRRAHSEIPVELRRADNPAYFAVLVSLVEQMLKKGRLVDAQPYLDEGLKCKANHADLLLLQSMSLWDQCRYEEVVGMLITFLVARLDGGADLYKYHYVGGGALKEVFQTLLPESYRRSQSHERLVEIAGELAEKTGDPALSKAYEIMRGVDAERGGS